MIVVLLVDDQRFVGAALGRLMAGEQDLQLHCCHDGAAAVAEANRLAPTLILVDLVVPGVDGLTLVGMLRSNHATAHLPIIVLSENEAADTRARALAVGAADYLVKMPSKTDLLACLRRHAAGRTSGVESTLDRGALVEPLETGTPAFTVEVIDRYVQESAAHVDALAAAAKHLDIETLKSTAHTLKSSSLIVGARRLAALCAQVEDHIERSPNAPGAPILLVAIDEEFDRVREAFAAKRAGLAGQVTA